MIAPSYVLAFVFLLSSSLLVWLLWHCRNALLIRLAPRLLQEEQESSHRLSSIDIESMYGPPVVMTRTAGTPQHVVDKLPVFTYKPPSSTSDDSGSDSSDQDAHNAGTAEKALAVGRSRIACDSLSAEPPAAEAAQDAAAGLPVDSAAVAAFAGQELAAARSDAEAADVRSCSEHAVAEQQHQHQQCAAVVQALQQAQKEIVQIALSAAGLAESEQQYQRQLTTNFDDSQVAQDADIPRDQVQDPPQQQQEQQQELAVQQQPALQQQKEQQSRAQGGGCARDGDQACVICFADYVAGDLLKQLPCNHMYHAKCIDRWLHRNSTCPLCKTSVWTPAPSVIAAAAAAAARRRASITGWGGGAAAAAVSRPAAAAGSNRPPPSDTPVQQTSPYLAELQRRHSISSSRRSSIGSYGSSLDRWDGMLLNARGSAAAAGAVAAAGAAVLRS